jgi:DNA-binding MarR family transcriptional regulator
MHKDKIRIDLLPPLMSPKSAGPRAMSRESRAELAQVIDSIRSIIQELRISGREAEQQLGLSSAQLFVLQALGDSPELSVNELAERTFTHQSSVSMVVARLVSSKLVTRKTTREDARRVSIALTAAGRAVLRKSPDAGQARLIRALGDLSRSDLSDLARNLSTVSELLEDSPRERTAHAG